MKFEIRTAVAPLILLNVVIFMLQITLGRSFTNSFMLISSDIFSRPWILLTSMFLHGGVNHILFNMYALFIFGPMLEQRIGAKRFLLVYILSGVIAAFFSSFFYKFALGASGAIMGMIGALIILMPDLGLLLFFVIPMPLWVAGIIYALMDLFGIFFPSGVGNIAHLVGMGIGLIYGLYLKKEKRKFDRRFSSKKHLESDDIEDYLRTGRI
ncbi:rhomboid family intramembrane serine protease [Candidatus Woesearchaeota archaeon]|nr:rhomboid family intramembrane serine protease [Candidatus Woesearchaeota archaeon]